MSHDSSNFLKSEGSSQDVSERLIVEFIFRFKTLSQKEQLHGSKSSEQILHEQRGLELTLT